MIFFCFQIFQNAINFATDLNTMLATNDSICDPSVSYALPEGIRIPSPKRGRCLWNTLSGHHSETTSECSEGDDRCNKGTL